MAFSGAALFNLVVSSEPDQKKHDAVVKLKTHVKKENVDLTQVQAYFEAIAVLMDSNDQVLQATTFSLLCHLVKRVSIQDSKSTLLNDHGFLVLPIIITRIADPRASIKISARRALEAYWLTAPSKVEQALVDSGLRNRSPLIINECVVWLNSILTEVNRHLSLNPFMNALADVLAQYESHALLVENIKILFANYYDLKQNRLHKYELQKILEAHKVSASLRTSIMGTDRVMKAKDTPELLKTAPILSRPQPMTRPPQPPAERPASKESIHSETTNDTHETSLGRVEEILAGLQNYKLDAKVKPINGQRPESLRAHVSEMAHVFEGKETERNWTKREASIASFRSLLRGNLHDEFREELVASFRDTSEGICKGLLSLRTTLSVNACHLVKEAAILLKEDFDPLVDLFVPTLIKLNSATKQMTTSNANLSMCAILASCSYSAKLLHKIQTASSEKGSNTRIHCGTWLRIFIARSQDQGSLSHSEIVERVLGRLLSDPISPVRQAAKEAFWLLQSAYPDSAERLLARLDANVVRGLERSKPSAMQKVKLETSRTTARPSIKESILARNKELNARRAASRSSSRNASQRSADGVEVSKNVGSFRQSSDPPSSGKRFDLPTPIIPDPLLEKDLTKHRSFHNLHQTNVTAQKSVHRSKSTNFAAHVSANEEKKEMDESVPMTTKDPIFQFLSSSNVATVNEGLNLLRFALMADEKFPSEIQFYLRKVSFTHPHALKALFESQLELFRKLWNLMTPEDALRVCCINFSPSHDIFDRIISVCDSDIYRSIGTILTYIADFDSIVGEKALAMQVIKFKPSILEMLVQFTAYCTSKVSFGEDAFHQLARPLFELVAVFHSMSYYDKYKVLIRHLYEVDRETFQNQLSHLSASSRKELEHLVGLDSQSSNGEIPKANESALDFDGTVPSSPPKQRSEMVTVSPDDSISNSKSQENEPEVGPVEVSNASPMIASNSPEGLPVDPQGSLQDAAIQDTKPTTPNSELEADCMDESTIDKPVPEEEPQRLVRDQEVIEESQMEFGEAETPLEDSVHRSNITPHDSPDRSPMPQKEAVEGEEAVMHSTPSAQRSDLSMEGNLGVHEAIVPPIRAKSYSPKKKADLRADHNIFASGSITPMRNEFINRLNSDPSVELVENFSQVRITNKFNSIQSFIDKVDPLNKVSSKAKPISIFEDTKVSGSPQKVKEYSYTELNLFNFSVARLALDKEADNFDDYSIIEYNQLCEDLRGEFGGKKFVSMLRYLQNEQTAEFDRYFVQEGLAKIEDALDDHFRCPDVTSKLNGLIILKQLLINRENIQFERLWNNLVMLCEEGPPEIEIALNEAFEETLCGMYPSGEMIHTIVKYFEVHEHNLLDTSISFVFRCLYRLIAQKALVLTVNEDLLCQLHQIFKKYLGHKKVEIRQNVFRAYGKLVRASRVVELSDNNKSASPGKDSKIVEEILTSLTNPQRRMIEYYSR